MVLRHEKVVKFPVADMDVSKATQARAHGADPDTVTEFAEAMKAGEKFPPVILYAVDMTDGYEGKVVHVMGDGYKRRAAAQKIGMAELDAIVRKGSILDALLCNIEVNADQRAERWTNADKKNSIRMVLANPESSGWSDNRIAKACGVSDGMVTRVRAGEPGEKPARRVGADGRSQPASRPRLNGSAPKAAKAKDEKPAATKKPGGVLFDWHRFNEAFGVVQRAPDEIAKAYRGEKDSSEYSAADMALESLAKVFKTWQRRLAK